MATAGGAEGGHRCQSGFRRSRDPQLCLERLREQCWVGVFKLTGCRVRKGEMDPSNGRLVGGGCGSEVSCYRGAGSVADLGGFIVGGAVGKTM